ncbi:Methionyl-tRNA formyltransferase [Bacillus sp. THAF10]|uniref:methionyl-tRNA formyltransferase n=1 Tax=Bacillus sp. THAF10 TaxID=2587848 RepID=UPI001268C4CF|nr:methionyl-tRNA formyltransferase [Bacillus sp. THAF10]QFT88819.1 Methionyl-tRNA formyltransferase [Bacillus sp. THAF10]
MKKIVFMGTPDFAVPVLQQIIKDGYEVIAVVTQPDRPKGRKKVLTPPPVKVEAEKHHIPVLQPEKIKEPSEYEKVVGLNPDLIVTAAFGQILPKPLLDAPEFGCINVHASLLPKYRGGAPIHYSIIKGEEKTGVTVMYMVEKLDAGDMLSRVEVPIEEDDHVGSIHDKLSIAGAKLLSETLPLVFEKKVTAVEQNHQEATFASNIKREQEKINWEQDGESVYNHIRGMHPWPVAYTTLEGQVMKIWWGEKVVSSPEGEVGTIIRKDEDGMVIKTGNDTAIKITDLQLAGKKRMSGSQFLNGAGANLTVGTKLGE